MELLGDYRVNNGAVLTGWRPSKIGDPWGGENRARFRVCAATFLIGRTGVGIFSGGPILPGKNWSTGIGGNLYSWECWALKLKTSRSWARKGGFMRCRERGESLLGGRYKRGRIFSPMIGPRQICSFFQTRGGKYII